MNIEPLEITSEEFNIMHQNKESVSRECLQLLLLSISTQPSNYAQNMSTKW